VEWQKLYQRQYHQAHLESRRARHRKWNKDNNYRSCKPRKPLTAEQRARRLERERNRRASPDYKAKQRELRKNRSTEQRARALEHKRNSNLRHADEQRRKRRFRHMNDPDRAKKVRNHARRNALAYKVLKELGISIDINDTENCHAAD
jgi:hypothetical protein